MHPDDRTSSKSHSSYRVRGMVTITLLFATGIGLTALFDHMGWDLGWTGHFYVPGGPYGGWPHGHEQPWWFLYEYGEIPALGLAVGALILWCLTRAGRIRQACAKPCLVIILTVVLGPGVIVNGILKTYWGRPRPVDVSTFGGTMEYRKVGEPRFGKEGKSFPCGHCSMAFAIASASAFYPLHPVLSVVALVGGISYGVVMGVARMAQGGHFPTDVMWSGILVLIIVCALYFLVFRIPESREESKPRGDRTLRSK